MLKGLQVIFLIWAFGSAIIYADDTTLIPQTQLYDIEIPKLNAAEALNRLAEQTDVELLYPYQEAKARNTNAVKGRYRLIEALTLLLEGSGLSGGLSKNGAIKISLEEKVRLNHDSKGREKMKPETRKNLIAAVLGLFMGAGGMQQTVAQEETDTEAKAKHSRPVLEEIVVTAEKREQNLQTIPIAVTAFTSEDLDRGFVLSALDLGAHTPGLALSHNGLIAQPYIRGIGSDVIAASSDSSIAYHVDGVFVSRPHVVAQEFFDVERVEVVKGPQGTLYGRNATGGAINVISKMPTEEFSMEGGVLYGNYDRIRAAGAVSGSILDGKLRGRFAIVRHDRSEGYAENVFTGGNGLSELETDDYWGGRITLQYLPTDNLEFIFRADLLDNEPNGPAEKVFGNNNAIINFGGNVPADPREVAHDFPMFQDVDTHGVSLEANWDVGNMRLTSITGYRDLDYTWSIDVDRTDINFAPDIYIDTMETYTQEFRIASTDEGRLEWIAGFYFLTEEGISGASIFFPLSGNFGVWVGGEGQTTAYAGFGQATYEFTPKLKFTAGIRYSTEEREHTHALNLTSSIAEGLAGGGIPLDADPLDKETWSAWTPKFGIDYFINDDIMLYASVTRGFKSGGFNDFGVQPSFGPEFVWSYEIGAKTTLLDDRLRVNMSAFYYDYTDIQVQQWDNDTSFASFVNADGASVKGAEIEILAIPAEGWELDTGLAFLDAEFDDFITGNQNEPLLGDINLKGNRLTRAPEFSATVGLQYRHSLGNLIRSGAALGTLTWRVEYQYQSEVFYDLFNDPLIAEDGYSLWNARVAWDSANGRWSVAAFGENLSDELYAAYGARADGNIGHLRTWGPPRTYGVQINFRY